MNIHIAQYYQNGLMNKTRRTLFNFFFGAVTCLLLVGFASTPAFSRSAAPTQTASTLVANSSPLAQSMPQFDLLNQQMEEMLSDANSRLIAQGLPASSMTRYVAVLSKNGVVGSTPSTSAFTAAGAALVGDRLMVRGNFSNLSSGLRDYATDPLDPPNPNITSGIHIHRGEPAANGPFQYALEVSPDASGLSGQFGGEYTLTSEQLQALASGTLYVDLHTKQNRAGEMRGILLPY